SSGAILQAWNTTGTQHAPQARPGTSPVPGAAGGDNRNAPCHISDNRYVFAASRTEAGAPSPCTERPLHDHDHDDRDGAAMITGFTPLAATAGGALIGLASVLLMAGLGRIFGATGILAGVFTPAGRRDLDWRLALLA